MITNRINYSEFQIREDSYLFRDKLNQRKRAEESVRQWVLFELLSSYGYHIDEIDVEVPVRLGSRKKHADIVVYDNEKARIVVECKRPKRKDDVLSQVIGYAVGLDAEYAVCTDGGEWDIYRNVQGIWNRILYIPSRRFDFDLSFPDHIQDMTFLSRIFYWYGKSVPPDDVPVFLEACSTGFISPIRNRNLLLVPECLLNGFWDLCFLITGSREPELARSNILQKRLVERTIKVFEDFGEFYNIIKYDSEIPDSNISFEPYESVSIYRSYTRLDLKKILVSVWKEEIPWSMNLLNAQLRYLIKRYVNLYTDEAVVLRACEAVSRYFGDFLAYHKFPLLSENQVDNILCLYSGAFLSPLGMYAPGKADDGFHTIERFCEEAWHSFSLSFHENAKDSLVSRVKEYFENLLIS